MTPQIVNTNPSVDSVPLRARLIGILRCPDCAGALEEDTHALLCDRCGNRYPLRNGVNHFVPSEDYASNFGFEWNKYSRTQLDHDGSRISEETFARKTG